MDISLLSYALRKEIAYPPEMAFVEAGILGRGFYPGCRGFTRGKSPVGGIMLLGRDFGTHVYYESLVGPPSRDENSKTWERTCEIYLPAAPAVSLGDLPVWCTNYLMGVRKDKPSTRNVKDRISPEKWLKYENSCWQFLQMQVLLQKPRLIVIFGRTKQFDADNQVDLLVGDRLGRKHDCEFRHTFLSEGTPHTATVTFANHPFSLISRISKANARLEVSRIRSLYGSQPQQGLTA